MVSVFLAYYCMTCFKREGLWWVGNQILSINRPQITRHDSLSSAVASTASAPATLGAKRFAPPIYYPFPLHALPFISFYKYICTNITCICFVRFVFSLSLFSETKTRAQQLNKTDSRTQKGNGIGTTATRFSCCYTRTHTPGMGSFDIVSLVYFIYVYGLGLGLFIHASRPVMRRTA